MNLATEYAAQYRWRDWERIFDALPDITGKTVLDAGCAVGDQAAVLVSRGARVIGIDANEELLSAARSRSLPNAEFLSADLRGLDLDTMVDGIWCSFTAAYLMEFANVVRSWTRFLNPGGWIIVTDVDNLFGHEPLDERVKSFLDEYAEDALRAGRYDFHVGHKLPGLLEDAGVRVTNTFTCEDAELSFDGAAAPGIVDAWRARFERMPLLKKVCGPEYGFVRDSFLQCLSLPEHRSLTTIYSCVGKLEAPLAVP